MELIILVSFRLLSKSSMRGIENVIGTVTSLSPRMSKHNRDLALPGFGIMITGELNTYLDLEIIPLSNIFLISTSTCSC